MRSNCPLNVPSKSILNRNGLLYLGAIPEMAMICLAVAVVLITIFQAKMLHRTDASLSPSQMELVHRQPILGIDFDRDREALIVHHWPDDLEEIKFDSGTRTSRKKPQNVIRVAASSTNSSIAYLTEHASDGQLHHEIYVMQGADLVLFEELEFEPAATGTVRTSQDGSIVIVVSQEGTVYGWDLSSLAPVHWAYRVDIPASLALLSPDGKSLLVADEKGICELYDSHTGVILQTFSLRNEMPQSGAWSPDNRCLAIGDHKGGVSVVDAQSGELLWYHKVDALFARCMAISSDGKQIAIGTFDKSVRIWNLTEPDAEPIELKGETSTPHNILFLEADSKVICGGEDGSIREWDLASREILRRL